MLPPDADFIYAHLAIGNTRCVTNLSSQCLLRAMSAP